MAQNIIIFTISLDQSGEWQSNITYLAAPVDSIAIFTGNLSMKLGKHPSFWPVSVAVA